MKLQTYLILRNCLILLSCVILVACGGNRSVKPASAPSSPSGKPSTEQAATTKPGGYYLDDGPGDNPPKDIDSIPNASPKNEPYLDRANRPYIALGTTYTPMTNYKPYKATGTASWYGKRYHGKNTSSGEVYDMYSMTAAHTTLPLPSFAKVTNPANGKWVIVRVNDRGPFKSDRIIDLSYAAAYKLRFSSQGSTLVQVEAIDPNNIPNFSMPPEVSAPETSDPNSPSDVHTEPLPSDSDSAAVWQKKGHKLTLVKPPEATDVPTTPSKPAPTTSQPLSKQNGTQYFVQIGAFKSEANADALTKKIQGLDIEQISGINKVYNGGLYRLKIGPYASKQEAASTVANIRKKLNTSSIITNQ
jgi:rare lipoprotein A